MAAVIMGPMLKNELDWPLMPALDDYIEARASAEKLAHRVNAVRNELTTFSGALAGRPHVSYRAIPRNWLSADGLRDLLGATRTAFDLMDTTWTQLSDEQKHQVQPPFKDLLS